MADPCIIDSQSISLAMNAGDLQAVAKISGVANNHLTIQSDGLHAIVDNPVGSASSLDVSNYTFNDDAGHTFFGPILNWANPSPRVGHGLMIAAADETDALLFDGIATFTFAYLIEQMTGGGILSVDGTYPGPYGTSRVATSVPASHGRDILIPVTAAPGSSGQLRFMRSIQRSNLSNSLGYTFAPRGMSMSLFLVS